MQSVFAYKQCESANFLCAEDYIKDVFSLDLNSMDSQDPIALDEKSKLGVALLHHKILLTPIEIKPDAELTKVVKAAIAQYKDWNKKDIAEQKHQMINDIDSIMGQYVKLLYFPVMLRTIILEQEEKKSKKYGMSSYATRYKNFLHNPILDVIENDKQIKKYYKNTWDEEKEEIWKWFKDIIRSNEEFEEYNGRENVEMEHHKAAIQQLIKKIIFKHEVIDLYMEGQDLNWAENKSVLRSLLSKTIKDLDEGKAIKLLDISPNWDEDVIFYKALYTSVIKNDAYYEELIDEKTKNWEADRIAKTDSVILKLAIDEMRNFSNIPVKVSINEYIEISKTYSTPKSKQFINGVLDVLAKELVKRGEIKKSGRGLIDNK